MDSNTLWLANNVHVMLFLGFSLLLVFLLSVWFLTIEHVHGIVKSKFTETAGRRGHNDYLIQMENGKVYSMFWGTRDWDRIAPDSRITFTAHGFHLRAFGWRLSEPTVFGFKSENNEN